MKLRKIGSVLVAVVLLGSTLIACQSGTTIPILGSSGGEKKDTLVVGLDDQFAPMGFRDENGNLAGFDIDLANEVGKRLNRKVILQPINWDTKEMELENGNVDLLWNGLTITEARKKEMLFSPPYLKNAQIIAVRVDTDIRKKADLAGKKVALQSGSSAKDAFQADSELPQIVGEKVETPNNVDALNDLELGRVDAVVLDKVVAEYYETKKPGTFRILEEELEPEQYGIAFKKENQDLCDAVVGVLREMKKDGTAEKISVHWFGENRFILE